MDCCAPRRPWYKLHLATLSMAIFLVTWAIKLSEAGRPNPSGGSVLVFGFPFQYSVGNNAFDNGWPASAQAQHWLIVNLCITIVCVIGTAAIVEVACRRISKVQFHLSSLILFVVACGAALPLFYTRWHNAVGVPVAELYGFPWYAYSVLYTSDRGAQGSWSLLSAAVDLNALFALATAFWLGSKSIQRLLRIGECRVKTQA